MTRTSLGIGTPGQFSWNYRTLGSICHQKPDLQKGFIADIFYVLGESRGCVEEHRGKETTAKKMDDMVKALHANACNYMLNVYVG